MLSSFAFQTKSQTKSFVPVMEAPHELGGIDTDVRAQPDAVATRAALDLIPAALARTPRAEAAVLVPLESSRPFAPVVSPASFAPAA